MFTLLQHLPTFLVIGAMKAGTTSLYHYLKSHDQIFMPHMKELEFFALEANWFRGMSWYRRQFRGSGNAVARGEASPIYTQCPTHKGVPERIAAVLPDVRLVYVVRDPIARMRSHYQHLVMTGVEKSPPEVALLQNPVYLDSSRYAMQLERYLDHFPREQILIVTSDDLKADRLATVQRVYRFLGVDPTHVPEVLATEFYRTEQRSTYSPAVLYARRLAKRHLLQGKIPTGLVDTMLAHRTSGNGSRATADTSTKSCDQPRVIDSDLRARLADLLRDDVARFRRYLPADFDGWGYV
jgi:hypothetical protein